MFGRLAGRWPSWKASRSKYWLRSRWSHRAHVCSDHLDDLGGVVVDGRWIPVLPLKALHEVLNAMGDRQRAEMVRRHLQD